VWEDAIFPSVSDDELAAALGFPDLPLPVIAGGALPEFLEDAWRWVDHNLLDPAGDFLKGILGEIGKIVAGAATTVFSWLSKNIYRWLRWVLLFLIDDSDRWRFPNPADEPTATIWSYWARIFRLPLYATFGALSDAAEWIWRQVKVYIGPFASGFTTLTGWIRSLVLGAADLAIDAVSDAAGWIWRQVKVYIGPFASGFTTLTGWIRSLVLGAADLAINAVSDAAEWIWRQVKVYIGPLASGFTTLTGWIRSLILGAADLAIDAVFDAAGWLWDRVEDGFADVKRFVQNVVIQGAANVVSDIGDFLGDIWEGAKDAFSFLGEQITKATKAAWSTIFEDWVDLFQFKLSIPGKIIRGEYQTVEQLWDDITDPAPLALAGIAGGLLLLLAIFPAVTVLASSLLQPALEPLVQDVQKRIGTLVYPQVMGEELTNREIISEGEYIDHLRRQGFSEENARGVAKLREQIPGPSDLVRMAVREAFDPGLAASLGYVTALPGDFAEWMRKRGYGEQWAERYWWAHWDLPSPAQGFEMYHRIPEFTETELRTLLKVLDIPPLWHDRFIKIAYNPISRIDIRRAWNTGVITERSELVRRNQDLGYSPEDSEFMADFVIKLHSEVDDGGELRQATQAQVIASYKRGIIDHEGALEMLMDLRYPEDVAELLLATADFDLARNPYDQADLDVREITRPIITEAYREGIWDRDRAQSELEAQGYLPLSADLLLQLEDVSIVRDLTKAQVSRVETLYKGGHIERGEAQRQLLDIGLPADRVGIRLTQWDVDIATPSKELTLAQLQGALRKKVITEDEFLTELFYKGYSDRDAGLILALS